MDEGEQGARGMREGAVSSLSTSCCYIESSSAHIEHGGGGQDEGGTRGWMTVVKENQFTR